MRNLFPISSAKAQAAFKGIAIRLPKISLARANSEDIRQVKQVFMVVSGIDGLPKGPISIKVKDSVYSLISGGDNCLWTKHQETEEAQQGFTALFSALEEEGVDKPVSCSL